MTARALVRQMLAALQHAQQENFRHRLEHQKVYNDGEIANSITAARDYLAQPEQSEQSEPVGIVDGEERGYASWGHTVNWGHNYHLPKGTKLYTAPPLRELSDADIQLVACEHLEPEADDMQHLVKFARAVLAAAGGTK